MKITDRDLGWRRIMRELQKRGAEVHVGIMGQEASAELEGSGRTVAEIMEIHEFGLGGMPRRSWLRDWFDARVKVIKGTFKAAAQGALAGLEGRPLRAAMDLAGAALVGDLQKRWAEGIPPPNAPSTVDQKGSSTPLIDTGQSRTSVTYRVEGV